MASGVTRVNATRSNGRLDPGRSQRRAFTGGLVTDLLQESGLARAVLARTSGAGGAERSSTSQFLLL